jgi:5-methyltetrahydropteroyltriglutamate--homocysteine methyltransferase
VALTHILGFPRIGAKRELKFALESFWRGDTDEAGLLDTGCALRRRHYALQREAGLDFVCAGDFSFYDGVLDHSALLGALPTRFGFKPGELTLARYFELARGNAAHPPLEMTKWFDTNYHYLVPELGPETRFEGAGDWLLEQVREALVVTPATKAILIGPITFLWLAKSRTRDFDCLALLPALLPAYRRVLARLRDVGVAWVQMDEPALVTGLDARWLDACDTAYAALAGSGVNLLLTTYFGTVADIAPRLARLPVQGFHIDAVRAPEQLDVWGPLLPPDAVLSVGIVDGRNIWRTHLRAALARLTPLHDRLDARLWLAASCSLFHVPVSLAAEERLDPEVKSWLAFATEKIDEIVTLARGLNQGAAAVEEALLASDAARASRRDSKRVANEYVRAQLARFDDTGFQSRSPSAVRRRKQHESLALPTLPTTTIGSFPQTTAIRGARAAYRKREVSAVEYLRRIRGEIEHAVRVQEAIGLDVLVHGEAERNDMVEHFAEHLWGYAITREGWVQSYGSRCVKPPIIYGDVCRPEPMTVDTISYAQSLTGKPVKGMLTGPVTMLQWSFVRDDQPRRETALQIALAIREEVADLQRAGIKVIQIDEPALREGLPLRREQRADYLDWAVRAFRLAAAAAADDTQIHTHMCYAEFRDILDAIVALDADVITIESSRSNMDLLEAFRDFSYPNDIGPGVYDIHSPHVPAPEEIVAQLDRATRVIPVDRLWVNPDCGLKTRGWPEVEAALRNMVEAARLVRESLEEVPQPSTGCAAAGRPKAYPPPGRSDRA